MAYTQTRANEQAAAWLAGTDSGTSATIVFENNANEALATVTLADPSFTQSANVLTIVGQPESSLPTVVDTIDAAFVLRDAVKLDQLTVGITGSGANVILEDLDTEVGKAIKIISATITQPLS